MASSRIPGLYKLPVLERRGKIVEYASLTREEEQALAFGGLSEEAGDRMIENVVGTMGMPFGVAVNFLINGREYVVPMVLEEPSVVAAASNMAKAVRESGGFQAS